MTLIHGAMWCAVLLACVGVILWAYMNVRARRITSLLGAFRCWSRPDYHAGWTADGAMVEVRLAYGEHRYEVAVERLTYNGLVSWVESGPPRRP